MMVVSTQLFKRSEKFKQMCRDIHKFNSHTKNVIVNCLYLSMWITTQSG